jgi:hypothetical protein
LVVSPVLRALIACLTSLILAFSPDNMGINSFLVIYDLLDVQLQAEFYIVTLIVFSFTLIQYAG